MSRSNLFWQVYDRLFTADNLDEEAHALVEASFDGAAAVHAALAGDHTLIKRAEGEKAGSVEPKRAFISSLEVEGFRGIGPKAELRLSHGPGLTLVVGRNGSGKSSFAEGLEVLLTGDSLRWKGRKPRAEWTGGWKNLHHEGATHLSVRLSVEGRKMPVILRRTWKGDGHESSTVAADYGDHKDEGLGGLGWEDALDTYRPILSYNQLGKALDEGPGALFEALRGVLGLEEVSAAINELAAVQKELNKAGKAAKDALPALQAKLRSVDDERARSALELLEARAPDLAALLVIGADGPDDAQNVAVLRRSASLKYPDGAAVLRASDAIKAAHADEREADASAAGRQLETEKLLSQALQWFEATQESKCPVCGQGQLDAAWQESTAENLAEAKAGSERARRAKAVLTNAVQDAKKLVQSTTEPPRSELSNFEVAQTRYDVWTAAIPSDPLELAEHLVAAFDGVEAAFAELNQEAQLALDEVKAAWRPTQLELAKWIDLKEKQDKAKSDAKVVKAALEWLRATDLEMRNERFAPIKTRATEIWNQLRHQSNVELLDIQLVGKGTKKQAKIDVAVDGKEAVALGVMSQGELHALLLALFIPRLTLPESPFGFLVIDDPVQAMDPAKVDGLANVLADVAQDRQVVVFTHDARLPEAVRRLQIPATVVQVSRMNESCVALQEVIDPAKQFIRDAFQVVDDAQIVGPTLVARVVPGLCRSALEARFKQMAWRKLIGDGQDHGEVEQKIHEAHGVHDLAAVAFFGDRAKTGEVYKRIRGFGDHYVDLFKLLKESAHKPLAGDARQVVLETQGLLRAMGGA